MCLDHPDIIMITMDSIGISTFTLASISRYAFNCRCLLGVNSGINRKQGELIQKARLDVLNKSNSEYVFIMDDDDELVAPVPDCSELKDIDVVFFNYTQDDSTPRDFRTCKPFQIFSFCGVILKREIAAKALKYTIENGFLREDIGFFYFIMNSGCSVKFSKTVLINKIGQREPQRSSWLKSGFKNEFEQVWRDRIAKLRHKEGVTHVNSVR